MLNLPHSTEVNRNISKNKFYEKADISSALKESFVNDIEKSSGRISCPRKRSIFPAVIILRSWKFFISN